jgi:hypothetical protein
MNLPFGADYIIGLRKQGRKPADPIIVSMGGNIPALANFQVAVTSPENDWRFMKDLDAIVYTSPGDARIRPVLRQLARYVRSMDLWDGRKGVTLYPVWHGQYRAEVQGYCAIDREDARFKRWATVRWLPSENQRFKQCA